VECQDHSHAREQASKAQQEEQRTRAAGEHHVTSLLAPQSIGGSFRNTGGKAGGALE
jgi:hypothetical protein